MTDVKNMKAKLVNNMLTDDDIKYYESVNPGFTVADNKCVLEISLIDGYYNGTSIGFVIFNGSYTDKNMVRDCGKRYQLSWGGRLYNIDKKTLEITPFMDL